MSRFEKFASKMKAIDDNSDSDDGLKDSRKKGFEDKITRIRRKKGNIDDLSGSDLAPSIDLSVKDASNKGPEEFKIGNDISDSYEKFSSDGDKKSPKKEIKKTDIESDIEVSSDSDSEPNEFEKQEKEYQKLLNQKASDSEDEDKPQPEPKQAEHKGIQEIKIGQEEPDDEYDNFSEDAEEEPPKEKKLKKLSEQRKKEKKKNTQNPKEKDESIQKSHAGIQEFKIGDKSADQVDNFSDDQEEIESIKEETKQHETKEFKIGEEIEVESDYEKFSDDSDKETSNKKKIEKKKKESPIAQENKIEEFKIGDTQLPSDYDGFSDDDNDKKEKTKPKSPMKKLAEKSKSPDPKPKKKVVKKIIKKGTKKSRGSSKNSSESPSIRKGSSITSNKSKIVKTVKKKAKASNSNTRKKDPAPKKYPKLNQDLMAVSTPNEFKINDQKSNVSGGSLDEISEEIGSKSSEKSQVPASKYLKKKEKPAADPNIQEFQINDNLSEDTFIKLEDEEDDTIRSSIYESIEKSTRLKEMAEKKFGAKDRPKPSDTESSLPVIKEKTRDIGRPPKKLEKSVTEKAQYVKEVNQSEVSEKPRNFQEFKINDADSKFGYEGFSDNPSSTPMSQIDKNEKEILNNLPKAPVKIQDKKTHAKIRAKNLQNKKKKEDNIGPTEFKISDDVDPDPTEGFESVEGENDQEKKKKKLDHKKAKETFKSKVKDYDLNQHKKSEFGDSVARDGRSERINPKEFVIGDSGSQAVDDGFAEKEKPSYADQSEDNREKSVALQSFTEPIEDEKSSVISAVARTHTTEAINPNEFKINDDISRFDEKDFSNNSQSNYAQGINKNLKRQKVMEKRFEKDHDTKLQKDLDIHSEQSVRLGENGRKRPKTAFKDTTKKGSAPFVAFKQEPVTMEKEVEIARKKLFRKLKGDKMKKKKVISQAVKKHVKKAPAQRDGRPKTAKAGPKEVKIQDNNENDYDEFLNGPRKSKVKQTKTDDKFKKKEQGWIGIGIGGGRFGEEELRRDILKKREARSIFNMPPEKPTEEEYDSDDVVYDMG
ncbi:unnamed protein product [Moneuplotes crassus]|uniref:Uncharacterized protein n=2 Tax=Euplotes crassus TaxID=5936 RepID=A0AAD1XJV2_EUPCR|nr:unnamed protein product [Moneuplotes crassus]